MAYLHAVPVTLLLVVSLGCLADADTCPPVTIPTDICAIRSDIAALQQKVKASNNANNQLRRDLDQAKGQLRNHAQLLRRKQNQVAFSARVTGNVRYSPNQVIRFPSVIINQGNRFNPSTSKFTCGDGGLYVFMATILGGPRPTWFQIVQDGNVKANGYTGDTSKSSATHVAIVRCRPGSHVWVRRTHFQLAYNHLVWEAHSEFSGFRFGD